jgi:outer membrane lipoprotein-sorting protein
MSKRTVRAPWSVALVLLVFALSVCGPAAAQEEPRAAGGTADSEAGLEAAKDLRAPDADELLRGMDELYESGGTKARVEVTVTSPDRTRSMRMRFWGEGEDRALIVIDAPPRDAGTATLKVDNNLWNYLPKISRTIRVPPSLMMGSWMGTDLTNDDLVRESSYEEDYDSTLTGRSEDPAGWAVRLEAKPDAVGLWNRVDMVFDYETHLPLVARFYDRKDRLSRTMRFSEVRSMDGRMIPTVMSIVPEREEGHSTELRYIDVDFDVEFPDDMFSLSRLERTQ